MEQFEFTEENITAGIFHKYLADIVDSSSFSVSTFLDAAVSNYDGDFFCINDKVVSKIFTKLCSILKTKWPDIKTIVVFFKKGFLTSEDVSFGILVVAKNSQISQSSVQFLVNNFKSSELAWKQKTDFLTDFQSLTESTFFDCEFDSSIDNLFPDEPEMIKPPSNDDDFVPANMTQIQASKVEVLKRINQFIEGKKDLMNKTNETFYALGMGPDSCSRVHPVRIRQRNVVGRDGELLSRCMSDSKST